MLENTVARGRAFSDTAARGRVFSEDSADIPFLTASIVDGERRGGFAVMLGASIDEGDGDEDDDSRASEDDESPTQQLMYRPRLGMVVLPSIVFFMSIFILIPASVQLQLAMVCGVMQGGIDCNSAAVSSSTGRMTLITQLVQSVPAFLLSGFYSSVANRYGRRACLIISLLGPTLYASVLLLLLYASESGMVMSYADITAYTTAGSLLLGLSGSFSCFQMASFSYAADITNKNMSKRGLVYTLLEASLFIGKVVGPASAGFYAQHFGFKVPLMCIISSCMLAIVWCYTMVREEGNFPKEENCLVFNPLHTFRNIGLLWGRTVQQEREIEERRNQLLGVDTGEEEKEERQKSVSEVDQSEGSASTCCPRYTGSPMPFVSAACFFYFCAFSGNSNVWYLFVTHSMGWGPSLIGAYDAYEGFFQFLSMTLVPWLIMKVFGRYVDIYWLLIGYVARAAHYALLGTVPSTEAVFAIAPLLLFGAILAPRSRSIVSQCVSVEEQVDVLSGFCAVQGSAQFFAPLMAYGYTVSVYSAPYAVYIVFSGLCALGAICILAVLYTPSVKCRLPATTTVEIQSKKDPHVDERMNPMISNTDLDLGVTNTEATLLSQGQINHDQEHV